MGRPAKLSPEQQHDLVATYKAMKNPGTKGHRIVIQLAAKYNISTLTAYKILRKAGIHNPRGGKLSEDPTS